MNTSPQLSTPEAEAQSMVAPGQENILEEFIQEQQAEAQAADQQRILGKFNSPEELAKAYQELEKKLGQPKDPASSSPEPSKGYAPEQAVQIYGEEAVSRLAEKGVDLADVMFKADSGQDISEHYDTLAETFNVPRQVVENYVSKAQATPAAAAPEMTEADAAAIKAMVGGEEGFADLSQWAAKNLDQQELAKYNAVVDSGNRDAIEWALKAMAARRAAPDSVVEPKLYGGGTPPATDRFESQQQVLDAMNKLNSRGQRMYDVDDAYRAKVQNLLANSDVF